MCKVWQAVIVIVVLFNAIVTVEAAATTTTTEVKREGKNTRDEINQARSLAQAVYNSGGRFAQLLSNEIYRSWSFTQQSRADIRMLQLLDRAPSQNFRRMGVEIETLAIKTSSSGEGSVNFIFSISEKDAPEIKGSSSWKKRWKIGEDTSDATFRGTDFSHLRTIWNAPL